MEGAPGEYVPPLDASALGDFSILSRDWDAKFGAPSDAPDSFGPGEIDFPLYGERRLASDYRGSDEWGDL